MSEHIVDTFGIVQDFADLHGDMSTPLYQAIMDVMVSRQREEVVRCRDCKFAVINTLGDCKYCEKFWDSDGDAQLNLPGDFFCAWGEKRVDR